MKRVVNFLFSALLMVLFAGGLAILLIEWMAGCGESYIDAKGERHQYECVFIPNNH